MKHAITIIALVSGSAIAQPYVGAGLGHGETGQNTSAKFNTQPYNRSAQDTQSMTGTFFAGYRYGLIAGEVGVMRLPSYRGTFDTTDYPAYKGLPPGTYPQTASATQSISASSVYARVNIYAPVQIVTPYAFAGMAYTETRNHEQALYNGVDHATYTATTYTRKPMYGIGIQAGPVRAEYIRINGASDSYHTLRRDVRMVMVSAVVRF